VRIASNFAVSVFDWLDIEPSPDPPPAIAASLVTQLHRSWRAHPVPALREDFRIPHRPSLESSLKEMNQPWRAGPYSEPARAELRACHEVVQSTLVEYDALVRVTEGSSATWCLTHGEPNGENLVRDRADNWFLVDWESARIAPPERDLWELSHSVLARYQELAGSSQPRRDLLHLYELWYALAETSVYLLQFRTRHTHDDNMAESWQNYLRYLPGRRSSSVSLPGPLSPHRGS
jgi:thiamine kinase-like enzyme